MNSMSHVLVAGGDSDPNVTALISRLLARGIAHHTVLVGASASPTVTWRIDRDELFLNGSRIEPAAVFARHDVFTTLNEGRPEPAFRASAWYTAIMGWAYSRRTVATINRNMAFSALCKPYVLCLAKEVGLPIPDTAISNDYHDLLEEVPRDPVAKPLNGGDYTKTLRDVLSRTEVRGNALAAPSIVQEQLVPPEIRIYGIGGNFLAFRVAADALDYRSSPACTLEPYPLDRLPHGVLYGLELLMQKLGVDFGAADFKATRAGDLRFLELNTGPMFSAFDATVGGALCDAMVDHLLRTSTTDATTTRTSRHQEAQGTR